MYVYEIVLEPQRTNKIRISIYAGNQHCGRLNNMLQFWKFGHHFTHFKLLVICWEVLLNAKLYLLKKKHFSVYLYVNLINITTAAIFWSRNQLKDWTRI